MHDPLPPAEEIAALPPDGGSEFNRLVHEASPYLRQHARNPVDWYPWGAEAFERARALDRPIFVSIGYSTCHWCHVMERESFEDDEVAGILADGYVAVKVDREERPDIDEIHMKATQLMSGHGGWPNSVWLTPDLRPWYAGTYFPPEDRPGRTGFKSLLRQLRTFWDEKREDVDEQATRLADAVRDIVQGEPEEEGGAPPGRPEVERLLHELRRSFDGTFGGFGGAPKFPPHGSLRILLAEVAESDDGELRTMLEGTLDALSRGGIHDHIGGGFHRYSTDREWLLPHFEKMLYDNAQLLSVLARADRLEIAGARETAEGIVGWVDREMTAADGGFLAALDADSEGEEGRFYVWTPEQVDAVLGAERGPRFRRAYDITDDGNFTDEATGERPGTSVPRLLRPLAEVARDEGIDREALAAAFAEDRAALLDARAERVRPHLDDKVITGWCALFAGALAEAGSLFGHPEWVERAARAVGFLLEHHVRDGRLHRSSREGVLGPHAFLEDHAALGLACLDLAAATGEERYAEEARRWAREVVARFEHPAGGFYDAAEDHELLLVRPRDPHDPAIPSGNGLAARLFHRLARLDDDDEADRIAAGTVRAFAAAARRAPRGTEALLEVVRARATSDRPDHTRGGTVAADWAEGTVHLALDHLDAVPGGEVRVQLEGGFGTAGRWQHGEDAAPGPEILVVAPEGATWRETDRSADAVAGTVTLPADAPAGPTLLALEWRGAPCRKSACLPAVSVRVECALLVRGG